MQSLINCEGSCTIYKDGKTESSTTFINVRDRKMDPKEAWYYRAQDTCPLYPLAPDPSDFETIRRPWRPSREEGRGGSSIDWDLAGWHPCLPAMPSWWMGLPMQEHLPSPLNRSSFGRLNLLTKAMISVLSIVGQSAMLSKESIEWWREESLMPRET